MSMSTRRAGCRPGSYPGFTLLELIITMAILALITSIIGGAFHLVVRSWDKGEAEVETFRRTRLVLDRGAQQLKSTYPYWIEENNDWSIAFSGGAQTLDFVSPLSIQSHLITGLVSVHYALEGSRSGAGLDFMAREAKVVDQESAQEAIGGSAQERFEAVLLSGIESLTFDYYVVPHEAKEGEWRQSWTWGGRDDEDGILPQAVRITLKQKPENPDDEPLVTAMTIPLVTTSSQDFAISQKKLIASQATGPGGTGLVPGGLPLPGVPPPIPGTPASGGPLPPSSPFDAPTGPAQRPRSTPFDGPSGSPPAGGHSTPFDSRPGSAPPRGSTPFN